MSLTNVRLQAQKRALHLFENPGKFLWMGFASHSRQLENQTLRTLIRDWAPEKTPATWRNPACGMGGQQEGLLLCTWTWLGAAQGAAREAEWLCLYHSPMHDPTTLWPLQQLGMGGESLALLFWIGHVETSPGVFEFLEDLGKSSS